MFGLFIDSLGVEKDYFKEIIYIDFYFCIKNFEIGIL